MTNSTTTLPLATAKVIREAAAKGSFTIPEVARKSLFGASGDGSKVRGQVHPAAYAAFGASKAGKGYSLPEGKAKAAAAIRTVEVPRVSVDAKGRKRTLKPVTMPLTEARVLAGEPANKKGAMSKAALVKAGEALVAASKKVTATEA